MTWPSITVCARVCVGVCVREGKIRSTDTISVSLYIMQVCAYMFVIEIVRKRLEKVSTVCVCVCQSVC